MSIFILRFFYKFQLKFNQYSQIRLIYIKLIQCLTVKKYLLSVFLYSIKLYAQQDLPYVEGDIDRASSNYSATPSSSASIPLYKSNYDTSKVKEYVDKLQKEENSAILQGGTLEEIIQKGKNKIDIHGGHVKLEDGYKAKSDARLKLTKETSVQGISDKQNSKGASNKISDNVLSQASNSHVLKTSAIIFLIIISLFFPISRRR